MSKLIIIVMSIFFSANVFAVTLGDLAKESGNEFNITAYVANVKKIDSNNCKLVMEIKDSMLQVAQYTDDSIFELRMSVANAKNKCQ